MTADGTGVVSHAGSRLLADLADRTTLTAQLSLALEGVRPGRPPAPRAQGSWHGQGGHRCRLNYGGFGKEVTVKPEVAET